MVSITIYLEGGGDSKELKTRCRQAFHSILKRSGIKNMPRLVACGGRGSTYDDFKTASKSVNNNYYPILLIDSEEPVTTKDKWAHLKKRDNWDKPDRATEEQVHFMATCMETWIVADRNALQTVFGDCLNISPLPSVDKNLETRNRHDVQDSLQRATSTCGKDKKYEKGKRSFQVVGELNPETLKQNLPHFNSLVDVLIDKLG